MIDAEQAKNKIANHLGINEILCQLAEESAELAQAALKLRRAYDGKNPTPKTVEECVNSLSEEIADVDLCLKLFYKLFSEKTDFDWYVEQKKIQDEKVKRWSERLGIE